MRIFEAAALFVLGALCGVLVVESTSAPPTVAAQDRDLTISSSCSSGDVVIYDGSNRLRCVDPENLEHRACDSDEVLGTDSSGRLRCIGPSTTPWGVQGLLPNCSSGDTLVSEGFGRWRCQSPSR